MLEQSLVPSKSERKRFLSLPLSAALHALVIAAAMAAAVWNVDLPKTVPAQATTYSVGPLPQVPAPPAARRGDGTPPVRTEPQALTPVAPDAIPDDVPDVAGEETDPGEGQPTGNGRAGGDPDGVDDGIDGGVGRGGGGDGVILRPGGGVTVPVIIARVDPEYPEIAQRIGLQGIVVLECIIGRDGSVRDARVVASPHAILDRAAIDALTRWRFRPATLHGKAVDVYFHLTVTFTINR